MKSREYFNSLQIIHSALLIGQVLFALVAYYLNSNGQFSSGANDLNEIFQIIVPVFVIGGITGSRLLTNARLKLIKEKTDLKDKLRDYRSALIVKFALLEFPSFFAIICFLLTGNLLFLALAGLMIIVFLTNKPTKERAVSELELNHLDMSLIEDPEGIVV